MSEATVLPTEPQPLPLIKILISLVSSHNSRNRFPDFYLETRFYFVVLLRETVQSFQKFLWHLGQRHFAHFDWTFQMKQIHNLVPFLQSFWVASLNSGNLIVLCDLRSYKRYFDLLHILNSPKLLVLCDFRSYKCFLIFLFPFWEIAYPMWLSELEMLFDFLVSILGNCLLLLRQH